MPNDVSAATLATLEEVRRELRERGAVTTNDERFEIDVMDAARAVTKTFEDRTQKVFQPRVEVRYLDAAGMENSGDLNGSVLLLDHPLYELTTLTNGDGTVITSLQYTLLPKGGPPYTSIRLLPGYAWARDANGRAEDAISVAGVYVGGKPYSGQWLEGVDILDGSIDADDEVLTTVWVDNFDPFQREPKFSPGMLLRLRSGGVTEYMSIVKASFDTKQLIVRRHERGTTATSHADETVIDVWWVDQRVQMAVARGAAYVFHRRGRFQTSEFVQGAGVAPSRWAGSLPKDVEDLIAEYGGQPPPRLEFGAV